MDRLEQNKSLLYIASFLVGVIVLPLSAQQNQVQSVNTYGVPGMIDMPNAYMQPDAEITNSLAYFLNSARLSLTFQITPRLQGVFRYSAIEDYSGAGEGLGYDRSFDLRYQVFTETSRQPALTIGLQDFGGTGIYEGEYVVASKTFQDRLTLTGGIGWGQFGSYGSFNNPLGEIDDGFKTRPDETVGTGGQFSTNQWFRGPAAFFGGVSYRYSDRLRFNIEYSSDDYAYERARETIEHRSPINVGFSYALRPDVTLSGYSLLGDTVGLNLTFALNPKTPPYGGSGNDPAPPPFRQRPSVEESPEAWTTDWINTPANIPVLEQNMQLALSEAGLTLVGYYLDATEVEVRFLNPTYRTTAQAIGRAARALTYALPASVERLSLVSLDQETALSGLAVTLNRSDLEELEDDPSSVQAIYDRASISDAAAGEENKLTSMEGVYPAWSWSLGPYVAATLWDSDNPFRTDAGVELAGRYEPRSGLVFSGQVRRKLVGNRNDSVQQNPSPLPNVRTSGDLYRDEEDEGVFIPQLMGEYFFRPGTRLYGRISAGYFETIFGGLSTEILWRPENRRWSLGADISYVKQREFDQLFGFQDYSIVTGHVSGYYHHAAGFYSQVDVGRYLAGDYGFTYTLTREFDNGWRVGGYFSQTDVSAEEFGEGSFDKGIIVTIPIDWSSGESSIGQQDLLVQTISRDGGAKLEGVTRLYEATRRETQPELERGWARIWR